ncbi:uncharacterized protein LOC124869041 [Girardinichthys multiradiatus]|uniref:uncharacterized protein LOC124869041 n=1 Tax=Girardinichthys multiradiatus TaxID=208333 RepID=UPI001FAD454F|nr:uncharacterized protein LOC124869041 [Girardinichthys multiradiatus]
MRLSENGLTLTIRDLTESDGKHYCCSESTPDKTDSCPHNSIQLQVADLQVKVFPATEGQKVTLMCTTSCLLTESPAAFIWYKNRKFLYEDWSPWYQELVSSDQAVRYSCAIKGYEDLRAPEVSVDSVTWNCFSVTYAEGRMCSYKQTSEKQSCSITFPTELQVERTEAQKDNFRLTCNSNCSLTDLQPSFQLYKNTQRGLQKVDQKAFVTRTSSESFFCSVEDLKDLLSNEVCVDGNDCSSVNYVSRRICGLKGSSVNISSIYSLPGNLQPQTKLWFKEKINMKQETEQLMEDKDDVKNLDNMKNQHILRLDNLDEKDIGEYKFRMKSQNDELIKSDYPGVTLVVTELLVDLRPAAEVTEGQRVTLTCRTSCPLSENTNYTWYLNSQHLSLTETQSKQLIIDAFSRQDEGNYSCGVEMIRSAVKTLTVQRRTVNWKPAAAGLSAALLVLVSLSVFLYRSWKYKISSQPPRHEIVNYPEEETSWVIYENCGAEPELHFPFPKMRSFPLQHPTISVARRGPRSPHHSQPST